MFGRDYTVAARVKDTTENFLMCPVEDVRCGISRLQKLLVPPTAARHALVKGKRASSEEFALRTNVLALLTWNISQTAQ